MEEKNRIKYIDLCKGLGILMVTLGHVTTLANPLDQWMSSMKLSIFFVAAGYLICYTNSYEKQTLKRYVFKLLKSLMVPYVLFSAFGITFRYFAMVLQNAVNMDSIKSYIFATITLRGIFALWFLPVLFFAEILFYCLIRYAPKIVKLLVILLPPLIATWYGGYLEQLQMVLSPLWYERVSLCCFRQGNHCSIVVSVHWISGLQIMSADPKRGTAVWGRDYIFCYQYLSVTAEYGSGYESYGFWHSPGIIFHRRNSGIVRSPVCISVFGKYWSFPILNYFGRNSLILMSTQRAFYILAVGKVGWQEISGAVEALSWRYYLDSLGALAIVLILEYSIITFINERAKFMIGKF